MTLTSNIPCGIPFTFGKTAIGGSSLAIPGFMDATRYPLSEPATLYNLSIRMVSGSGNVRLAVYSDQAGAPQSLLAECPSQTAVPGWNTLPLGAPTVLGPGDYWLTCQVTGSAAPAYDAGAATSEAYTPHSYGSFPSVFPLGTTAYSNFNWSLYAEYCAAPPFTPTSSPTQTPIPTEGFWQPVGNVGFSPGQAAFTSLFIDGGTPYVAFYNNAGSSKVMQFDGTGWADLGNATGIATYASLFVDSGTPYLAFSDDSHDGQASVVMRNGSSWENVGSMFISTGDAHFPSLYVSNGTPYVAYEDKANGDKATLMKYEGGSWSPVGGEGFTSGAVEYTSLYVDNGTAYVAFRDNGNSGKPTVMTHDGIRWVNLGSVSEESSSYLSIYVDGGTPYVAFEDWHTGKATVGKYNGSSWEILGGGGFSRDLAEFESLFVYNGTPYVAFTDWYDGQKATVMKYDGVSWVPVGNTGFSDGTAYYPSLFVYNGTPYVAYMDAAHSYKATVMKYVSP